MFLVTERVEHQGGFPCMFLALQTLVGVRENIYEIQWGIPTIVILSVQWAHESLVAHGHGPLHSSRQPNCSYLLAFVIFVQTHPTHYYLEYSGSVTDMETHPQLTIGPMEVQQDEYDRRQSTTVVVLGIQMYTPTPNGILKRHTKAWEWPHIEYGCLLSRE